MKKTKLAIAILASTMLVGCGSTDSGNADVQIESGSNVNQAETPAEQTENAEKEINKVLYDKDGLKATFTTFIEDGFYGPEIRLQLENTTDKSIMVQVREVSINGFMIDPSFSEDVAPGKKANGSIDFFSSTLEESGIEQVDNIELSLTFIDKESYDTIVQSEAIKITINETAEEQQAPTGETLYDKKGITIVYKNITTDDFGDVNLNIFVENNSKQAIKIQARDCSVNGFMIDPVMSSDIGAGKKINDKISFMEHYLEENDITEFETVEMTLKIMDDNYDDIAEVPVSLKLK